MGNFRGYKEYRIFKSIFMHFIYWEIWGRNELPMGKFRIISANSWGFSMGNINIEGVLGEVTPLTGGN